MKIQPSTIVLPKYDVAEQKVRGLEAAQKFQRVQVETLHLAGIWRERAQVLSEGLSRLAWTA